MICRLAFNKKRIVKVINVPYGLLFNYDFIDFLLHEKKKISSLKIIKLKLKTHSIVKNKVINWMI